MNKIVKHKEKVIGLIISLIFIGLIFWRLDFHKFIETFKSFNYKVLLIFIPMYILSLYLRGWRWKFLLCGDKKMSVLEAFFTFTTGNTLNSYLPARAGDFWRAYHMGAKLEESKMKILGSIILERIIDGISVVMILFFAVIMYFRHQWVLNITYISAGLFLGSLTVFFLLFKFNKIDFICEKLSSFPPLERFSPFFKKLAALFNSFMSGFQSLNSLKYFSLAFLMSCLAWGIECFVTYILLLGFGHHFGFSIAFFVISFLALSTVIPSSSIFVGPYQYAYILALGIYHVEKSQALGIAFIHQIVIMLIVTFISIIYFNLCDLSFSDIKAEIEENDDKNS